MGSVHCETTTLHKVNIHDENSIRTSRPLINIMFIFVQLRININSLTIFCINNYSIIHFLAISFFIFIQELHFIANLTRESLVQKPIALAVMCPYIYQVHFSIQNIFCQVEARFSGSYLTGWFYKCILTTEVVLITVGVHYVYIYRLSMGNQRHPVLYSCK